MLCALCWVRVVCCVLSAVDICSALCVELRCVAFCCNCCVTLCCVVLCCDVLCCAVVRAMCSSLLVCVSGYMCMCVRARVPINSPVYFMLYVVCCGCM
jgi:hypothetical protein